MIRYLLFAGDTYYPGGGWDDFFGGFTTIEAALAATKVESFHRDWWHIVDLSTLQMVTLDANP